MVKGLIAGMFGGGGMSTESSAAGGPAESGFYGDLGPTSIAQDNSFQVGGSGRSEQRGGTAAESTAMPRSAQPVPQWVWIAGGGVVLIGAVIFLSRG